MEIEQLFRLGATYTNTGKFTDALECFNKILEKSYSAQDNPIDLVYRGHAYNGIGTTYTRLEKYENALQSINNALDIFKPMGFINGEGNALMNKGYILRLRGEYGEAMTCSKDSLQIIQKTGDVSDEGIRLLNIGAIHSDRGEYGEAIKCFKDSLQIFRRTGDASKEGHVLANIGTIHNSRGENGEAMKCYKDSLQIFQQTGDVSEEGHVLRNIGIIHSLRGEYGEAMKCYKDSLQIFQQTGDVNGKGQVLMNFGTIHMLGYKKYVEAIECFKDSSKIFKETGDLHSEAKASNNLGVLYICIDELGSAELYLRKSLSFYEKIFSMLNRHCPSKVSIVDTYVDTYRLLTFVLVELERQEDALLVTEKGRSQALRDTFLDKYGMETAHSSPGVHFDDAQSLISSKNSTFVTCCFVLMNGRALLLFPLSQTKMATVRCESEDDLTRSLKQFSLTTIQGVIASYAEKVISQAKEYLQQNRENTFEDRSLGDVPLKVGLYKPIRRDMNEPFDKILNELFAKLDLSQQSGTEESGKPPFDKAAPENEYKSSSPLTSGGNKTKKGGMHVIESTIPGENLLRDLNQALIAPIESELDQPEVVIIPDGPLFFVPFAALQAPDGKFLSETKRIRIGPSLTTLKLLKDIPAEKQSKTGALIIGGPCVRNVMRKGKFVAQPFSDLKYAWKEATNIGKLLHEQPLIIFSATKDKVLSRLQEGVAIIHMATHGSGETGELVLSPGLPDGQRVPTEADYMLTVQEISSCNINAQLVVLSCCHTGTGEVRAEGAMSLARAFLVAGARSVLATLWQVSDQGTLVFMDIFYRHLTSGKSACTSLQEAMREMRATPRWNHWSYWGAFFIIGHDVTPFSGHDVTPFTGHVVTPFTGHDVTPFSGQDVTPFSGHDVNG